MTIRIVQNRGPPWTQLFPSYSNTDWLATSQTHDQDGRLALPEDFKILAGAKTVIEYLTQTQVDNHSLLYFSPFFS